jgi:O-antigen/teichoic acid export membrane protein
MMELTFALHNKDYKRFSKRVKKLFLLLIVGGTIIITLALLIGIPVLSFVYGVNLTDYRWPLAWMIFAGVAGGGSAVASWLLTLMRQFRSQIGLFLSTFIVGVIVSVFFVHTRGIEGAFIGFTITYTVQLLLFLLAYNVTYRRHKRL